jgi:hypothetical protein
MSACGRELPVRGHATSDYYGALAYEETGIAREVIPDPLRTHTLRCTEPAGADRQLPVDSAGLRTITCCPAADVRGHRPDCRLEILSDVTAFLP